MMTQGSLAELYLSVRRKLCRFCTSTTTSFFLMGETKKYHFEKNYKCVVQICEKQVMTEDEECLSEMLGGISFDGAAWKEDIEDDTTKPKLLHGRVDPVALKGKLSKKRSVERSVPPETETLPSEDNNDESIFQNAYCYTSRGTERPHVRICNVLNRGKALVATRYIKKGTCLYTEKAIVATQVTNMEGEWPPSIKACQYCFCSLESSLAISDSMPYPDLWPVPSLSFPTLQDDRKFQNDNNGRVKCADCQALFCSKNCFSMQNKEYGSCCYLTKMVKLHQRDKNHCLNEAPVALAARLFCHVTNFYRTHHELRNHYIFGFCGEANELTQLEIGYERVAQDTIGYTLEPLYASLIDVLAVSSTEQKTLSLDLLHSLASKAQRNGFAIRTQSPFKPYVSLFGSNPLP